MGRVWKGLEMLAGEAALKYCKPSLMGDSGVSSEDENADRNAECRDQAPEVSDGNEDFVGS